MNLAAKCLLLASFFIGAHAPALAADSETFGKYCQRIKAPEEIEPLTEDQVAAWLDEFGGAESLDKMFSGEPSPAAPTDESDEIGDMANPFPPGYGEDLLRDNGEIH